MDDNEDGESAIFYERRRQWADYISTHRGLSDRAFRVGFWLSRRMNAKDRCCWYSKQQIADRFGRHISYVDRALAELRAANVMIIVEDPGRPNAYFMHAPFF